MRNTSDHLFITGKAGTGKTTLLKLLQKQKGFHIATVAPTGIAAIQARGQTIHSFFGFPPKLLTAREMYKSRNHRLYKKLDVIIIDEISMVRADVIDAIDIFLRINRDDPAPFGGVRMILVGDLYQLPPVVSSGEEKQYFSSYYPSPYFFDARVFGQIDGLEMIELGDIFRQTDRSFINLLNSIRNASIDYDDLMWLNERVVDKSKDVEDGRIVLSARNATADRINFQRLESLEETALSYTAYTTGVFGARSSPADQLLVLKEGAQVMFLRNDPDKKYVNGTLGKVSQLTKDSIKVQLSDSEEEIDLSLHTWEAVKYILPEKEEGEIKTEVIGTFKQYPIKLAWAVTIHKSQGKTFDKVRIDLGRGAFESGQTYVALSRCRSFEGIQLSKPMKYTDIIVDERIVGFLNSLG